MRVLHIGFPNVALGRAFASAGDYRFIDWTAWAALPNNVSNLHKCIIDTALEMKPDIIFMQVQAPGIITVDLVKKLSTISEIINWTWDYRDPTPEWMLDVAPYVVSAFTNEVDVAKVTSLGHRALFLQGGFDADVYNPQGVLLDDAPEIVFMANNYPTDDYFFPLAQFRVDMVEKLKSLYGDRFAVYGFGWPGQNPLQSYMHRELKEAACYRSCKVAINLSHFKAERYTSDRMFRILGAGAMCLSHIYPGLEKDFVDGVHLRTWGSIDDLVELIDIYTVDGNQNRRDISESGCNLAHLNYTWASMVDNMMNATYNL